MEEHFYNVALTVLVWLPALAAIYALGALICEIWREHR